MKKIITVCFVLFTQNNFAQNVGIGTASPQTNLHVNSAGSTIIRNESTAGFEASLELKTSGAFFDFLELRKWKTGAGGSLASIPLDGLSQITTGAFTTGGLLLGTKSSYPLYFTSNTIERMRIGADGNVGINTLNPAHALHVTAKNKYGIYSTATANGTDTIAGVYGLAISPTPVPYSAGVRGESNSTNYNGIGVLGIQTGSGWGVAGFAKELGPFSYGSGVYGSVGDPLAGSGIGGYGVYGTNNNIGGSGGYFYDNNGSATSYALKTQGKLKFNGIGEANGKVLTSDASGNATWGNLPGGANAWTVSGSNIYNSNTGYVGIGHNNPTYALDVRSSRGSLFIENPVTQYNATVQILRSVPENISPISTALYVEAGGDAGAVFKGAFGGIIATSSNSIDAGAKLVGNGGAGIALELDGGIRVDNSAPNKPVFIHVAAAANISGNYTSITYPTPSASDIVMVTPNWTAGSVYNNHPIGVFFTAGKWAIFNQDLVAMPAGTAFNVMVVRQ
jgi:hypothetical protein